MNHSYKIAENATYIHHVLRERLCKVLETTSLIEWERFLFLERKKKYAKMPWHLRLRAEFWLPMIVPLVSLIIISSALVIELIDMIGINTTQQTGWLSTKPVIGVVATVGLLVNALLIVHTNRLRKMVGQRFKEIDEVLFEQDLHNHKIKRTR